MKRFLRTIARSGVSLCFLAACTRSGPDSSRGAYAGIGSVSGSDPSSEAGGAGQTGELSSGGAQSAGGAVAAGNLGTGGTSMGLAGSSGSETGRATAGKPAAGSSGAGRTAAAGIGGGGSGGHATGTGNAGAGGSISFDPCPASGDCKVLPLGDSITYGSTTNNGGYRVQLFTRAHADAKHLTFVGTQLDGPTTVAGVMFPRNNEGHPGWTIAQIIGIADASQALKNSPQIVLLHIGTNDMGSMSMGAPARLEQLIDKIVAALPNALVVVSSIIPLPWTDMTVTAYNATIPGIVQTKAAQGRHVMYVEMHQGFPSNGLGSDNIHPNDNIGYPWMGDKWYAAIASYLH